MAEAAPARQGILWYIGECCEDTNLRRHHRLLPCCRRPGRNEVGDGHIRRVKNFEYHSAHQDAAGGLAQQQSVIGTGGREVHPTGVEI